MKKIISIIIGTVAYFGVFVLLDYLFSTNINWKMAIASSIIFGIFEFIFFHFNEKKK